MYQLCIYICVCQEPLAWCLAQALKSLREEPDRKEKSRRQEEVERPLVSCPTLPVLLPTPQVRAAPGPVATSLQPPCILGAIPSACRSKGGQGVISCMSFMHEPSGFNVCANRALNRHSLHLLEVLSEVSEVTSSALGARYPFVLTPKTLSATRQKRLTGGAKVGIKRA